jgi:hypothetical protein
MRGMFKALTNPGDAAGKTVLRITEISDRDWIVAFTDHTYLRFGIEFGYYGDASELTYTALGDHEVLTEKGIEAGLATRSEVDEFNHTKQLEKAQRAAERELQEAQHERWLYQQLKQKYEGIEQGAI